MKRLCNGLLGSAVLGALALQFSAAGSAQAQVHTVYSFCSQTNCADGANPYASLIELNGMLYGTTEAGGSTGCEYGHGCGTVFSLDPDTDVETVLYTFGSQQGDGANPYASLIDVNGTLYGTTKSGGGGAAGTVFSLDPSTGVETVLYSFCSQTSCADGAYPTASLIDVNGTLYGTTQTGGSGGSGGTVFSLDPRTGAETVLYSFCNRKACKDGAYPYASLIDVRGTLYGTTWAGGTSGACGANGCGTVFSLDLSTGTETVLYSFCSNNNCTDGQNPEASLINVKDTLYGTTYEGGIGCNGYGCGTVFSFDLDNGIETTVHSFLGIMTDGSNPMADLIDLKGKLYGTTSTGGTTLQRDWGTVFSLDLGTGTETVLYAFCSRKQVCKDGQTPTAGLLRVKGRLYGTTYNGSGTVFRVNIP